MQVDFTIIRRGNRPLKAFVATLGFSRASYVRFFDHERNDAWVTGLREACHFFGEVPQEVLFDNASTIIHERDAYGEGDHRWHPVRFCCIKGWSPRKFARLFFRQPSDRTALSRTDRPLQDVDIGLYVSSRQPRYPPIPLGLVGMI